jgi:hypothetical protein
MFHVIYPFGLTFQGYLGDKEEGFSFKVIVYVAYGGFSKYRARTQSKHKFHIGGCIISFCSKLLQS